MPRGNNYQGYFPFPPRFPMMGPHPRNFPHLNYPERFRPPFEFNEMRMRYNDINSRYPNQQPSRYKRPPHFYNNKNHTGYEMPNGRFENTDSFSKRSKVFNYSDNFRQETNVNVKIPPKSTNSNFVSTSTTMPHSSSKVDNKYPPPNISAGFINKQSFEEAYPPQYVMTNNSQQTINYVQPQLVYAYSPHSLNAMHNVPPQSYPQYNQIAFNENTINYNSIQNLNMPQYCNVIPQHYYLPQQYNMPGYYTQMYYNTGVEQQANMLAFAQAGHQPEAIMTKAVGTVIEEMPLDDTSQIITSQDFTLNTNDEKLTDRWIEDPESTNCKGRFKANATTFNISNHFESDENLISYKNSANCMEEEFDANFENIVLEADTTISKNPLSETIFIKDANINELPHNDLYLFNSIESDDVFIEEQLIVESKEYNVEAEEMKQISEFHNKQLNATKSSTNTIFKSINSDIPSTIITDKYQIDTKYADNYMDNQSRIVECADVNYELTEDKAKNVVTNFKEDNSEVNFALNTNNVTNFCPTESFIEIIEKDNESIKEYLENELSNKILMVSATEEAAGPSCIEMMDTYNDNKKSDFYLNNSLKIANLSLNKELNKPADQEDIPKYLNSVLESKNYNTEKIPVFTVNHVAKDEIEVNMLNKNDLQTRKDIKPVEISKSKKAVEFVNSTFVSQDNASRQTLYADLEFGFSHNIFAQSDMQLNNKMLVHSLINHSPSVEDNIIDNKLNNNCMNGKQELLPDDINSNMPEEQMKLVQTEVNNKDISDDITDDIMVFSNRNKDRLDTINQTFLKTNNLMIDSKYGDSADIFVIQSAILSSENKPNVSYNNVSSQNTLDSSKKLTENFQKPPPTNSSQLALNESKKIRKLSQPSNIPDSHSKERIKYGREFLYSLQYGEKCLKKPDGLPNLPDVVHNQPTVKHVDPPSASQKGLDESDVVMSKKGTNYPDMLPPFAFNMFMQQRPLYHPMIQRFHPSMPMIPPSYRASSKPNNQTQPQQRKVIQVSLQSVVQLHTSQNAWKPPNKLSDDKSVKSAGHEDLLKKVRSILNKLTPQKFEILLHQVQDLPIDTEEKLNNCIDLIFEKAISEPSYSIAYANMAKCLINLKVPVTDSQSNEMISFRKLLLNCCQREFEKDKLEESHLETMQAEIDRAELDDVKRSLIEARDEAVSQAKRRSLGNIRFIGELFKLRMLTEGIMLDCVARLLRQANDADSVECLCRLLTTIGKELDIDKLKVQVDENMKQLKSFLKGPISSRIRFMVEDVLELRENNWVPRHEDMKPKMIDQIHKDIQKEGLQRQNSMTNDGPHRQKNMNMDGVHRQSISLNENMHRHNAYNGVRLPEHVHRHNSMSTENPRMTEYSNRHNTEQTHKLNGSLQDYAPRKMENTKQNGYHGDSQQVEAHRQNMTPKFEARFSGIKEFVHNSGELTKHLENGPHRNHSISFIDNHSTPRHFGNRHISSDGYNAKQTMTLPKSTWIRTPNGNLPEAIRRRSSIGLDKPPPKPAPVADRLLERNHPDQARYTNMAEERIAALAAVRDMSKSWSGGDLKPYVVKRTSNKTLLRSEAIEKKCVADINEYLSTSDVKEGISCMREVVQKGGGEDISSLQLYLIHFVNCCLDKSDQDRDKMLVLLVNCINSNIFSSTVLLKCMREVLSSATDIHVDIPMIWTYIAEITSGLIVAQCINMPVIGELASFIEDEDKGVLFVALVLKMITKVLGQKFVADVWFDSIPDFVSLVPLNKLNAILKQENMGWLCTKQSRDYQYDTLLERSLTVFSSDLKFSNQEIQNHISTNAVKMKDIKMASIIFKSIFFTPKKDLCNGDNLYVNLDLLRHRCNLFSFVIGQQVESQILFIKMIVSSLKLATISDDIGVKCLQIFLENNTISTKSFQQFLDSENLNSDDTSQLLKSLSLLLLTKS